MKMFNKRKLYYFALPVILITSIMYILIIILNVNNIKESIVLKDDLKLYLSLGGCIIFAGLLAINIGAVLYLLISLYVKTLKKNPQ